MNVQHTVQHTQTLLQNRKKHIKQMRNHLMAKETIRYWQENSWDIHRLKTPVKMSIVPCFHFHKEKLGDL
jgi:ATP-dependent Zn protease